MSEILAIWYILIEWIIYLREELLLTKIGFLKLLKFHLHKSNKCV